MICFVTWYSIKLRTIKVMIHWFQMHCFIKLVPINFAQLVAHQREEPPYKIVPIFVPEGEEVAANISITKLAVGIVISAPWAQIVPTERTVLAPISTKSELVST